MDMATLVEEQARKAVVFRTPGVSRGFLSEGKMEGEPDRLKIEGVNLQVKYSLSRTFLSSLPGWPSNKTSTPTYGIQHVYI